MAVRCSMRCDCGPDAPWPGTSRYGRDRVHVDSGDLTLLDMLTGWIDGGVPAYYGRCADGEFDAIRNRDGCNADGQDFRAAGLGAALVATLHAVGAYAVENPGAPVIMGGDWDGDESHKRIVEDSGLIVTVPWGPNQPIVNGIICGDAVHFFRALIATPGKRYLVANEAVGRAAAAIKAEHIEIPHRNAWNAWKLLYARLIEALQPGDVVLYACGMSAAVWGWDLWRAKPGTTHIDVGHFFDYACGRRTRRWHEVHNERLTAYRETFAPRILGRVPW